MEEIKEKKFIIEAKGEVPFAQRTGDGYELFNNERTMKFCARRQQIRNNETNLALPFSASLKRTMDGYKVITIIRRKPSLLLLRI